MPRVNPRLLRQAFRIHPYVAELLPCCRDLSSARNELRWLKEHADSISGRIHHRNDGQPPRMLRQLVARRAKGEPLQYILGSEFFGALEIKCKPGVLIPRRETAASVTHLVRLLDSSRRFSANDDDSPGQVRVLDLCTGTGCIPLLFHHEFYQSQALKSKSLGVVGIDISPAALTLARKNRDLQSLDTPVESGHADRHMQSLKSMEFVQADVLSRDTDHSDSEMPGIEQTLQSRQSTFDVLTANPPYISKRQFLSTTSPSVRKFEPKLALVPSKATNQTEVEDGDQFYPRLLDIAEFVQAKVVLFEMSDLDQALRVAIMAERRCHWKTIEIWCDEPSGKQNEPSTDSSPTRRFKLVGQGNARSMYLSVDPHDLLLFNTA